VNNEFFLLNFLFSISNIVCYRIKNTTSWGGQIEVSILSKYYKIEICVVDIQTCRIDRFGEDQNYTKRVFIIYDGIHLIQYLL
jgi:ubiquitin thioesterase OTU1